MILYDAASLIRSKDVGVGSSAQTQHSRFHVVLLDHVTSSLPPAFSHPLRSGCCASNSRLSNLIFPVFDLFLQASSSAASQVPFQDMWIAQALSPICRLMPQMHATFKSLSLHVACVAPGPSQSRPCLCWEKNFLLCIDSIRPLFVRSFIFFFFWF